jgi:DNA-directed RNA polymerase specialized sigma24 family protein
MNVGEYFKAFKNNNQGIICAFYEEFEKKFKNVISRKFGIYDNLLLTEVYQDAIVRMWENIQRGKITLETLSSIDGYLYGIGKNVVLEKFRDNKNIIDDDQIVSLPNSDDSFIDDELDEQQKEVREVVYKMGKPCAPLLLKFYWDAQSWEDIAAELGYANANSAKTQKNKCMNKIKSLLKG